MPNPAIRFSRIAAIRPRTDADAVAMLAHSADPDSLMEVLFETGIPAMLIASTPAGRSIRSALERVRQANLAAYVETDPETNVVTDVLLPFIGTVRSIEPTVDGDYRIELQVAASAKLLKGNSPYLEEFLSILKESVNKGTRVAVTVAPIGPEVLDVRKMPPEERDVRETAAAPELATHVSAFDPDTLTSIQEDRANGLFALVIGMQCNPVHIDNVCIPFRYVEDSCHARAHKIARMLEDEGVQCCKKWAFGPIEAQTANHPHCRVKWDFVHVATAVRVGDARTSELMIIDPSLFEDGPVPERTWVDRFNPAPSRQEITSSHVFNLPPASSPEFDSDLIDTNYRLHLGRTALESQVRRFGAPPYPNCGLPFLAEAVAAATASSGGEITRLLANAKAGEEGAGDLLFRKVRAELHRLAAAYLRKERPGHLLQPTMLVHDAYLALIGHSKQFVNRNHFFAVAAQLMRQILVDHARAMRADKRGGGIRPVELNERIHKQGVHLDDVLALDEALERLGAFDERQSKVVELRIFGGLGEEEIASLLGVSSRTVKRDWAVAKAWLAGELRSQSLG